MSNYNYFIKCSIPDKIKNRVNAIMNNYYPDHSKWFQPNIYPLYERIYVQTSYEYLTGANDDGQFDYLTYIKKPTSNDFNLKTQTAIYYLNTNSLEETRNFCTTWHIQPILIGWIPNFSTTQKYIQYFKTEIGLKTQQRYSKKLMSNWNTLTKDYKANDEELQILYKLFVQIVPRLHSLAPQKITEATYESFNTLIKSKMLTL